MIGLEVQISKISHVCRIVSTTLVSSMQVVPTPGVFVGQQTSHQFMSRCFAKFVKPFSMIQIGKHATCAQTVSITCAMTAQIIVGICTETKTIYWRHVNVFATNVKTRWKMSPRGTSYLKNRRSTTKVQLDRKIRSAWQLLTS